MLIAESLVTLEVEPNAAGNAAAFLHVIDNQTGLKHKRPITDEEVEKIEDTMNQFDAGLVTAVEMLSVVYNEGGKSQDYVR